MEMYLDHASSTIMHPEVIRGMQDSFEQDFGNPSSMHQAGYQALQRIQKARESIAFALNCPEDKLFFTSGGTEANATAIQGSIPATRGERFHYICSTIEHASVLRQYERMKNEGLHVSFLPVNQWGQIDLEALESMITPDTRLISLIHVNNETGIIQPVTEAIAIIKKTNPHTRIHLDGVQAFGKTPQQLPLDHLDYYTVSAHKINGPRGVGALYVKEPAKLRALMLGGGQESGIRSGTENTPGIVGFQIAAQLRIQALPERSRIIKETRNALIRGILGEIPEVKIIQAPDPAEQVPDILMVCFQRVKSEVLLRMLSDDGIYLTAGSACHSSKDQKSHVLDAMGISPVWAEGSIRISMDDTLTRDQLSFLVNRLSAHVRTIRQFVR